MSDLIGKNVKCFNMPESSFYDAISGTVEEVKNGWATVRATQVMDRWNILWQDHPSSCLTSARVEDLELS